MLAHEDLHKMDAVTNWNINKYLYNLRFMLNLKKQKQ